MLFKGGNLHKDRIAAPVFRDQFVLDQFLFHPVRVGSWFIDLVNRHNNWDLGRFGVVDRLYCLRHYPVIRRYHQHGNICDLGASGPHGGKGFMPRGIHKSNFFPFHFHLVGADMLGNASGFQSGDI